MSSQVIGGIKKAALPRRSLTGWYLHRHHPD